MGVAPFDINHHHIGIGPSSGSLYGFLIAGAYARAGQNYGSPTDFGGARDLIGAPSLSRWTQDDFSGGSYAYTFGKDVAMYSTSQNMIPSPTDRTLRTCPPLASYTTHNTGAAVPIYTFQANGGLFSCFGPTSYGVRRMAIAGKAQSDNAITTIAAWRFSPNEGVLYGLSTSRTIVRYPIPDPATTTYTPWTPPAACKGAAGGLAIGRSQLMFSAGNTFWAIAIPDNKGVSDATVDGDYHRIGRLPAPWVDSCDLNGLTYILCGAPGLQTHLVAYDGNAVADTLLPVVSFDYNFQGNCLQSYGGRLYIGGAGKDINGAEKYAELYEVTGNTLRLVRTFAPESRAGTAASKPKGIKHMVVHEGILWFGDTGSGLVGYDITADAFHGGPMLPVPDGVTEMNRLVSAHDDLWAWCKNPGNPTRNGWNRIARTADGVTAYKGRFVTSDFCSEQDRRKRWSQMKILSRYGPVEVGYSINGGAPGGDTFIQLGITPEAHGDLYTTTVDLSAIPVSHQIRFRIDLPRGNDVAHFTELIAYTVGFMFLDSGKWAWSFTINGTERSLRPDGGTEVGDVHDIGSELRRYWRDRVPLQFRDLTGDTHQVVLSNFNETMPLVAEAVGRYDAALHVHKTAQEALYNVTLVEV